MEANDWLCSTDALAVIKESQVRIEREAGGVKNVKDLRSLHWGLAKIFDMRIPV